MENRIVLPKITAAGFYDATKPKNKVRPNAEGRVSTRFEWELPVLDGGSSYVDHVAYPVDSMHLFCIRPKQKRIIPVPYQCYYIHFTLPEGKLYDVISRLEPCIAISNKEKFSKKITDIIVTRDLSRPENEILMYSNFLKLLYMILDEQNNIEIQNKKGNLTVSQAIYYLEHTKSINPSLAEIAEEVHVNPIYLQRIFKKTTGVSPRQYLLNKKITQAKNLLLISKKTYAEIALVSGFSSQSYFNYIFKREVGMTPSEYVMSNNHNFSD